MRILYGITANGNGHLSRSRRIVRLLRERGHELEIIISGSPGKTLMDNEELLPYHRFEGFSFASRNGTMSVAKTLLSSKPGLFLRNLLFSIPAGPYDLAIVDFEPLTGWYARLHGIRSVGVCHMYAFLYDSVPKPPSRWYERLAYRWLAPADLMLGTHWHPYHKNIIPPFVPPLDTSAEDPALVLVYLPWEEPSTYLPVLRQIASHRFVVYAEPPEGQSSSAEGQSSNSGHVVIKQQSRAGFLADLARCSTVVANAGFALAGEAVSLGKRLMLKPYSGQPEQEHNALEAERLGFATRVSELSAEALVDFLATPRPSGRAYPDITPRFVSWLERGGTELDEETYQSFWG